MSRLSYDAKEADLEREFGRFGPIERVRTYIFRCYRLRRLLTIDPQQIRIVTDTHSDKKKKPHRGYAFIVYEREKDMKGTESSISTPINSRFPPLHVPLSRYPFKF